MAGIETGLQKAVMPIQFTRPKMGKKHMKVF